MGFTETTSLWWICICWRDTNVNIWLYHNHTKNDLAYKLVVYVDYLKYLKPLHKELPLLPKQKVTNGKTKLKYIFQDKKNYTCHIRLLQQALTWIKSKKVHRVIKFKHCNQLKLHNSLNTKYRTNSLNEFGKNLYKFLNNSVFCKTIRSNRKQRYILYATNETARKRLASSAICKGCKCISDYPRIIEMSTKKAYLEIPLYESQWTLDVSKILVCNFYYNYIIHKWSKNNVRLIYIDTDSLVTSIKTDYLYEYIKDDVEK